MTLDRRSLILLTIAALSAVLAAWAVRSWMSAQEPSVVTQAPAPPQQIVAGVKVLVAAENLSTGHIVAPEDLKWQDWPEKGLSDSYITRETGTMDDFVGAVIRESLGAGEPVTPARVVRAGDRGFLAAVLSPDMRAITIPINVTNSIAGLLFPGDRVDLIVTHDVGKRRVSETVLTNIRVLAVDARVQSAGQPAVGNTVTVEVTPGQAEEIIVARGIGSFSLALRSLASKTAPEETDGPIIAERGTTRTFDSDVSRLLGNQGANGEHNVVVMRGTSTTSQKFQKVSK